MLGGRPVVIEADDNIEVVLLDHGLTPISFLRFYDACSILLLLEFLLY